LGLPSLALATKTHTEKALVLYSLRLNLIIAISTDVGSVHDFDIFKKSKAWIKTAIQNAKLLADSGFQGVQKYLQMEVGSGFPNEASP
jgi:hypothetical protein